MSAKAPTRVWYVAYASNLSLERFRYYLRGGAVPGGSRTYPGCRDAADPEEAAGLCLPGRLVFAGRSTVWGGGMAFHDPGGPGQVAARGYLVTPGQFADVVAQEVRQPPGGRVALGIEDWLREQDGTPDGWDATVLYDSVTVLGRRNGVPLVTIARRDVAGMTPVPPAAAYLSWIVTGLREAHGWETDRIDRYLARMPGIEPRDGDPARVLH
ncbi:hypothetical protein [Nocardioides sp. URHA0032]|uniref:hypothetical protein n=1 Tax=Nocardioides sp. URHA0032 TaxID=1380388 RepID=UPI00055FD00A|nr:hypothetical protein [Nocardioides sp. URHA0032]